MTLDANKAAELVKQELSKISGTPDVQVLGSPAQSVPHFGFKSKGDYLRAHLLSVKTGSVDPRIKAIFSTLSADGSNTQYTGSAQGGFDIPQVITEIKSTPLYRDGILERVSKVVHAQGGNVLTMPFDQSAYEWATSGQVINRTPENTTFTPTQISGVQRQLMLYKYTELLPVTDELLSDNQGGLVNHLVMRGESKMRYAQTYDVIQGGGTTQAQGWINSPAAVQQGRWTAGTVKFPDLANMLG